MQKDNYDSISRRNFLEVLLLSSLGLFLSACNRLMGNSPIPSPKTFESSETPTKAPSITKQPTPTRDSPITTPEPTNTQKPALTPTKQLNLHEFVEKFGLDKIEDIRRDYQRTGNISVPITGITKEDVEHYNYWFAFREDEDGDLYLLDFEDKYGWILDVESYPLNKEILSDIFRYYEVRTGDLIIINNENKVLFSIADFYVLPTLTPTPMNGTNGTDPNPTNPPPPTPSLGSD